VTGKIRFMRQRTIHSPSQTQSASESGASLAPYAAVVERAQNMFAGTLAGVVAFGSWMRGEMTDESDIDALVVLDPGIRLTRRLYDDWDREGGIEWRGTPVDVHFTRLPERIGRATAFWGELALDGAVAFERNGVVSEVLGAAKAEIDAGLLRFGWSHGGRYWIEERGDA